MSNKMHYRRFGKTELMMPVLTCGGMRYQQSWQEIAPAELDATGQANLEATIRRAFELGINHIETAKGYGSSEYQLGLILPKLPRQELIVQTKITPQESEDAFLRAFEKSLGYLQLDYVDLLSIHGINDDRVLEQTLTSGTLKAARKLQDQGLARHIGFSTHGWSEMVVKAIETDEFSYLNLHWYYFDQQNWPAIEAATARDMGVFIISPNDKGGKLYEPPRKLVDLCAPYTPMGFNDLFCLSRPEVHTLSIGAARPGDFDAHVAVMDDVPRAAEGVGPIVDRLETEAERMLGKAWMQQWAKALPPFSGEADRAPVYHVLRMYTMAKAFDMLEYGKMRYNLLGNGGHWFPGAKVDAVDMDVLAGELAGHPLQTEVVAALEEAHALFNAEDKKRLSES